MGKVIEIAAYRESLSPDKLPSANWLGTATDTTSNFTNALLAILTVWAGCATAWSNLWLAPTGLHIKLTAGPIRHPGRSNRTRSAPTGD